MPGERRKLLILGGTEEARRLAAPLADDPRFEVVTSLAGRTSAPQAHAGTVRSGGFGGADGLARYIKSVGIALVVDATHPFAAQISANAAAAGATAGVPCLRLERPAWDEQAGDDWTRVADITAAARAVPAGARALVTVGRQEVAPFFARDDITVVARMIEPPEVAVPENAEVILARPPFTLEQERTLMTDKGIEVLVSKNSGGGATYSKLEAARELGLPVIMVARPAKPPLPLAAAVDDMVDLIGQILR